MTLVFNSDLGKSLPLLATARGQKGNFEVKKKKIPGSGLETQVAAAPVVLALKFLDGDHRVGKYVEPPGYMQVLVGP